MNNIKSYSVPKYFEDKKFSYKLFLNFLLTCNYSVDSGEWFLYGFCVSKLSRKFGISRKTITDKLEHKVYNIKEDEFGQKHLYISTSKNNFLTVKRENLKKVIELDEMTIRLYLLILSWKYNKISYVSQEKILDLIGYSGKSAANRHKLTKARRLLEELGLIKVEETSDGIHKYIIYKKI